MMSPLELAFYFAITGGVIAYVGHMWWQDEKELRKEARWQRERHIHNQLFIDTNASIDEINNALDQLEKHQ